MANTGYKLPGSGASGSGGFAWSSPNNIIDDTTANYAILALGNQNNGNSAPLIASNFNLNIPSGNAITAVIAQINGKNDSKDGEEPYSDVSVNLRLGGANIATLSRTTGPAVWPKNSAITKIFGSVDNTKHLEITSEDANDVSFGVSYIIYHAPKSGASLHIYTIKIDVYYESMSNGYVNDGGLWKPVTKSFINDGGVQKGALSYINDGGVWKL